MKPEQNHILEYPVKHADKEKIIDQDQELLYLNKLMEDLTRIIRAYTIFRFKDRVDQLECICTLIDEKISGSNRKLLFQTISDIGFENIQMAFNSLNQVCDDASQEREDLFGILKRHRLNLPVPDNDEQKVYRIGQFLNVTLIHFNIQKKKGIRLTDLQKKIKIDSAKILLPLFERLVSILKKEIQSTGYTDLFQK